MSAAGIIEHFSALPDPRVHARKNEHELIDIIVIAVCAVRRCEKGLVRRFLGTAERLPSLDTFNMLFSFISPDEFQRCFSGWIRAAVLNVKGCIAMIDAMGCQKKIVKKIIDQGGDYAIAVGHGRNEVRWHFMTDNLDGIPMRSEWKDLRYVGAVIYDVTVNG